MVPRQPRRLQRRAVLLLKTILDLNPEHENPALCARWRASGSVKRQSRGIGNASGGAMNGAITSASVPVRANTWTAWRSPRASGARRCRSASPMRTRERCRPLSAAKSTNLKTGGCWPAACFQNTSLLLAKVRATEHGRKLGTRPPRVRQFPDQIEPRVLLVRGVPRRPGRGGQADENPARHAQHRGRSAVLLSKLLMLTAAALTEAGLQSLIADADQARRHQAEHVRRYARSTRRCSTRRGSGRKRSTVRPPSRSRAARSRRSPSPSNFPTVIRGAESPSA